MGRTLSRVFSTCRDISFVRYMCCDEYSRTVERSMKKFPMDNGVTDSIRQMLVIFNDYSRNVVNFSPTGAITHPLAAPHPGLPPPPPPLQKILYPRLQYLKISTFRLVASSGHPMSENRDAFATCLDGRKNVLMACAIIILL